VSGQSAKPLRVAIVGTCQVVGLAAAARLLLADAEVSAWHVGVHPKDSDEELLALLPRFDVVISQLPDWDEHVPLRITRLRELGLPVFYLPGLVFAGFHPDIIYIRRSDGFLHGVDTDYHSTVVAAAFTLGLPEWRVPGLFNAYVFAELGYFDVFEASKAALFANFAREGIDLAPLFAGWRKQIGQFMHTINHPHIQALAGLCHLMLSQAGLIDAAAPLPAEIEDALAAHFVWPAYPALAKQIGISGSTTFLRRKVNLVEGQARELSLADYVSTCYRLYGDLPKDTLRIGVVATACERLEALVVS
jgi:hypothetical protein